MVPGWLRMVPNGSRTGPGKPARVPAQGWVSPQSQALQATQPRGPFKGPRDPFKGPRGPLKGPRVPLKGPWGLLKGPRGPFKGPRDPFKGPRGPSKNSVRGELPVQRAV